MSWCRIYRQSRNGIFSATPGWPSMWEIVPSIKFFLFRQKWIWRGSGKVKALSYWAAKSYPQAHCWSLQAECQTETGSFYLNLNDESTDQMQMKCNSWFGFYFVYCKLGFWNIGIWNMTNSQAGCSFQLNSHFHAREDSSIYQHIDKYYLQEYLKQATLTQAGNYNYCHGQNLLINRNTVVPGQTFKWHLKISIQLCNRWIQI